MGDREQGIRPRQVEEAGQPQPQRFGKEGSEDEEKVGSQEVIREEVGPQDELGAEINGEEILCEEISFEESLQKVRVPEELVETNLTGGDR